MAATSAIPGFGSTLAHCDTIDGSYTDLAEVIEITPQPESGGAAQAGHLNSDDGYEEHIGTGKITTGTISATLNFIEAEFATLRALLSVAHFWKITYNDGHTSRGTLVMGGILTECSQGALDDEDRVTLELEIQPTGKPVFTAGSS